MVNIGDTFTETSTVGWGTRLKDSIGGLIFGLLFFLASFALLWWNEGRAVDRRANLLEAESVAIAIKAEAVDAANEGKLVHMSGLASSTEMLRDALFEFEHQGLRLRRSVEMYQWEEDERTETSKSVGGSEKRTKTYSYSQTWSDSHIDSSSFKKVEGHENPSSMPFSTSISRSSNVSIGAFRLSESLVDSIDAWQDIAIDAATLEKLKIPGDGFATIDDGRIYIGLDPQSPAIGDIRAAYAFVPDTQISLLSSQRGNTFAPFITSRGGKVEELVVGTKTKEEMFLDAHSANTFLTWMLRLGGYVMMVIGLASMGKPLSVLADFLPILGSIVGVGVLIFSLVVALALSLITIAIAWIFYRPIFGIPLLIVGLAILYMILKKKRVA